MKYVLVGIVGTLIDVGVLAFLVEYFQIDPTSDARMYLFVTIAFLLAVANNFLLNQWWTFQVKAKGQKRRFTKFLLVSLGGLLLSNFLMFALIALIDFLVDMWHFSLRVVFLVVIAKVITSAIVLVWNFFLNKYWTFRARILEKNIYAEKEHAYDFSIVIPAYNEEKRLPETLSKITTFLGGFGRSVELIVADDGSTDGTISVVRAMEKELQGYHLRILTAEKNSGKGSAVCRGMLAATGKYILFTDADNSTPIEELVHFEKSLKTADILIGSRYLPTSMLAIKQPWYRILLGRAANFLIQCTLVDDVRDTQCGFKLFSYQATQDIFSRMKINGFGFDMEALALAEVLGYSIKELPVSWYNSSDSRVRPIKDAIRTLTDLVTIKLGLWGGAYKDQGL